MSFRIGIIGLGQQGKRHLKAVGKLKGAKIIALCDSQVAIADECKRLFPSATYYRDFKKMLKNEELDLILIATHAPLHCEMVLSAVQNGVRRIFCEKPMALSLKEADLMIGECGQNDVSLAINHCRRWWEPYRKLKSLLSSGKWGKLVSMHLSCGGGRLCSNGGHIFDLMRYLSGSNPLSIIGMLDSVSAQDPRGKEYHDPGGMAWVNFENGVKGVVDLSEGMGTPPMWQLLFSDGRIMIDELKGVWTLQGRNFKKNTNNSSLQSYVEPVQDEVWKIPPLDIVDLTTRAIAEMMDGISPCCSGIDGRKALEMSLGAHYSHRKGRTEIKFPLDKKVDSLKLMFA